jgi:hypothetical protein
LEEQKAHRLAHSGVGGDIDENEDRERIDDGNEDRVRDNGRSGEGSGGDSGGGSERPQLPATVDGSWNKRHWQLISDQGVEAATLLTSVWNGSWKI